MDNKALSPREKARKINLDPATYGSFAEIGGGQEVAAIFFKAGGASGSIAKTMSAYDMTFSNAIYGTEESGRYVCESRLDKMLNKEYSLLEQRLGIKMGFEKCFFAYANTVTTINYHKTNQGHGWMGVRFQLKPQSLPNDVILHVKLHDKDALLQQQSLGILGVNLLYACFYLNDDPEKFIISLLDNLTSENVEVDLLRMTGPDFEYVDNRLLSLELVTHDLTKAAIFDSEGNVIQPSDLLYKKNILALRGRFRPFTNVNLDMLKRGFDQFCGEDDVKKDKIEILAELTLNDLLQGKEEVDIKDFLDRVDILCSLGCTVMISNYQEYYRLVSYFAQFTKEKIGIVLGMNNLEMIFNEKFYEKLQGGILESFSTLFSRNVKLYVYPAINLQREGKLQTCENFNLPSNLIDLFQYLLANDKIEDIRDYNNDFLHIYSDNVLKMIQNNEIGWEKMLPDSVTKTIKSRKLFGYQEKNEEIVEKESSSILITNAWKKLIENH